MKSIQRICIIFMIMGLFIGCEDEKDDKSNGDFSAFKGTYKLSEESWDCDGAEDVQYITFTDAGLAKLWDFAGDSCDLDDDCYWADPAEQLTHSSGDVYTDTDGVETTIQKSGDVLTLIIAGFTMKWDKISDDVETYSPICD